MPKTDEATLAAAKTPRAPTLHVTPTTVYVGDPVLFTISAPPSGVESVQWQVAFGPYVAGNISSDPQNNMQATWDTGGAQPGTYIVTAKLGLAGDRFQTISGDAEIALRPRPILSGDVLPVAMRRSAEETTSDAALWVVIRNSANALGFENYISSIDAVMCGGAVPCDALPMDPLCSKQPPLSQRRALPFPDIDAYRVLKIATECFLMMNCGVYISQGDLSSLLNSPGFDATAEADRLNQSAEGLPDLIRNWWKVYLNSSTPFLNQAPTSEPLLIPYLAVVRSRLRDLVEVGDCQMGISCYGILKRKLTNPCLMELIWSYWMEEGMLVQTLNAISRRFQNFRGPGERDPLERFDIDPLRALNNLFWGYIQDEQHRLTVVRRAYEYNHHYGLNLEGKAVRGLRPADNRSKFLEAFHNLLYLCTIFFKEDDDTTVVADGFPVLNALKETHYVLAAGAHNQFGDLPSTARQEMLMQQWLLARPEMREFLGGKIMVPYPEEWMDRVDNVKAMKGWTDVSIIHFRDLAVYGEQIFLSIRYGAWSITNNPAQAANWARYWRPEIQAYIHAYRAVTGVDLTTEPVNATLPSVLLLKRLAAQRPMVR
jgi:hypothetical protein